MTQEELRRNSEAFFKDAKKIKDDLAKIKNNLSNVEVEIRESVGKNIKPALLHECDRLFGIASKYKSCADIARRIKQTRDKILAL